MAYYRLRQVDLDEVSSYSVVVKVDRNSEFGFSVYPNPSSSQTGTSLSFTGVGEGEQVVVVLYSVLGEEVYTKVIESADGSYHSIERQLPSGVYVVVASSDECIHQERIVVRD